jgi:UbiA prenyltransferase family
MSTFLRQSGLGVVLPKGGDLLFLVHVLLPVVMGWSLAVVIGHAAGGTTSETGLNLLMSGIGAAYSLDRLWEREHHTAWIIGFLWCIFLFCSAVIGFILVNHNDRAYTLGNVIVLTVVSLLYTRLKKLPVVKTMVVALSWTWACSTLPSPHGGLEWISWSITLPILLLISAGCILCDLKDCETDRQHGIPSIPVLLGVRFTIILASGMALAAGVLASAHRHHEIAVGSVFMVLAAQFPSILSVRPLGAILIDAILTVPGLLIAVREL